MRFGMYGFRKTAGLIHEFKTCKRTLRASPPVDQEIHVMPKTRLMRSPTSPTLPIAGLVATSAHATKPDTEKCRRIANAGKDDDRSGWCDDRCNIF